MTKTLAKLIYGVMNHQDCPDELSNVMGDALMEMASGSNNTPEWIQFVLDRQREKDTVEKLIQSAEV